MTLIIIKNKIMNYLEERNSGLTVGLVLIKIQI